MFSTSSTWCVVTRMVRLGDPCSRQQAVVELLARQDVETERRLVEHQQLRVDGHHERQVQLRDHALGELADPAGALDGGALARKVSAALRAKRGCTPATKSIACCTLQPARQHRDVGDEGDALHQLVALVVRVESEHAQRSLAAREPEHRLERGGLAGAVRADQADDAAGLDLEGDAVERRGLAEALPQSLGFDQSGHEWPNYSGCRRRRRRRRGVRASWPTVGRRRRRREQLRGVEAEPLDRRVDARPLVLEETLALVLASAPAAPVGDVHAAAAALLDQLLVDQLLVALEHGQRIQPVLGGDVAHRRQRIAFLEQRPRGSSPRRDRAAGGRSAGCRSTLDPRSAAYASGA